VEDLLVQLSFFVFRSGCIPENYHYFATQVPKHTDAFVLYQLILQ